MVKSYLKSGLLTKIKTFALMGCMFLLASTCKNDNRDSTKNLTYWTSNNGGELTFAKWAVHRWNAENTTALVAAQPIPEGQSSEEILLAAVVAGTTPDIYSNIWQGLVEFYSSSGILVALDTLQGFKSFLQGRCDSATVKEITSSDGHIYQIPWKINPIMTIYNKAALKEVGMDSFPKHYEDYLKVAALFKKDKNGDGHADQWFGNTSIKLAWYQRLFNFYPLYLAASGGMPLIKDNKADFNNRYGIEVMTFLQNLYRQNYFSRQVESAGQDLFIAGNYASKWTGPWEIEYLEKFKRKGFEYDFCPMPVPTNHLGPTYTYCDPKSIIIFNTCQNPQRAFDFIKKMLDEEGDLEFLKNTNQLPRRKNLDSLPSFNQYFDTHPKMKTFADQSKFVRGSDVSVSMVEVFDIISQEYEACVIYQKKTPQQAIIDAEYAVNLLLKTEGINREKRIKGKHKKAINNDHE
jgi:multiple sugar transport system substrate-binding protein